MGWGLRLGEAGLSTALRFGRDDKVWGGAPVELMKFAGGGPAGKSMRVFRICKERYSAAALSGEGARLYAGRGNEAGVPMVYAATSRALAAMEFFVHLEPSLAPLDLVMVEVEMPETASTEEVRVEDLAQGWRAQESDTVRVGTVWALAGRSLALRVPSAVVEGEWNVLLNPRHAEFSRVVVVGQVPFHFDERMFR